MFEGDDFDVVAGETLKAFLSVVASELSSRAKIRHLLILYESGLNIVCIKTEKPKGRKLRRYLAEHVLPMIRRGELPVPPAASVPSLEPVEGLDDLVEQLRAFVPGGSAITKEAVVSDLLKRAVHQERERLRPLVRAPAPGRSAPRPVAPASGKRWKGAKKDPMAPSAVIVRTLRKALGWTQETLAQRAGFGRVEVLHLEHGRNHATSARVRDQLAAAFELDPKDLTAALNGEISADELAQRMGAKGSKTPPAAGRPVRQGTAGRV